MPSPFPCPDQFTDIIAAMSFMNENESREAAVAALSDRIAAAADAGEKIELLHALSNELAPRDPGRALEVALEALAVAEHDAAGDGLIARCNRIVGERYKGSHEHARALRYLGRALRLIEDDPGEKALRSHLLHAIGTIHYARGKFARALDLFTQSLTLAREARDGERIGTALVSLGDLYRSISDYVRAQELLAEGLRVCQEIGDRRGMAAAWNNIAIVHCLTGNAGEGVTAYLRSIELYREIGDRQGETVPLGNVGLVYLRGGDPAKGYECFMRSLEISRDLGQRRAEADALLHLGEFHLDQSDVGQGSARLHEALAIYDDIGVTWGRASVQREIGRALILDGRTEEAFPPLQESLAIALELHDLALEGFALQYLSSAYESLGDYARALEHYKKMMDWREAAIGHEVRSKIMTMQVRLDIERIEREREIYRLKTRELEREMQRREEELTSMALHLAQKNELIFSLKREIAGHASDDATLARSLMQRIDEGERSDEEWERFERHFHQLHPAFAQQLLERCAELTPSELKVCSLLRVGLSSKEMANLLCTTIRTVEKHRQHIRRKLRLEDGENLVTLLASI
jgi:tetratricopeptide (TPR) repeat protein